MSYAGDPYKYDVFFSYAHGVKAMRGGVGVREWSRTLISEIADMVLMSLADEPGGDNVGWYLDRDEMVTSTPLNENLEEAVKGSAILVVLMSPNYKDWGRKELNWFLDQAKADGRGFRQCVLLEVQRTPDNVWPEELRDGAGARLLSQSVMDENGFPLGYEWFRANQRLPDTGGLVTRIAVEIKDKLLELRRQIEAERAMAKSKEKNVWALLGQEPPDDLLIYLDAEPQDEPVWQSRREALAAAHAVVLPDEPFATDMATRSESILSVYKDCDALVLHRVRVDDLSPSRVRRAYQARKSLYQKEQKALAWALLDELPDTPLPSATTFRIPRVLTTEKDWPDRLFQALGGGHAPAEPA